MPAYVIEPLEGQCVVVPDDAPTKVGSIFLPDNAQEKPVWGTVIAVGPGKDGKQAGFKKGDTVLYNRFGGYTVELPKSDKDSTKQEYRILSWDNVTAKLVVKAQ